MKNIFFGLLVLLTVSAFSCEKEEVEKTEECPELSHQEIYECFQKTEWDEALVEESLTGKWERVYIGVLGETG